MSGTSYRTITVRDGLGYSSLVLNRQNLSASRQQSILPPSSSDVLVEYSLESYGAHVTRHGGDGRAFVLDKLRDMKIRLIPVTTDNLSEVAAWLLVLRHSLKSLKKDEIADPCVDREKIERDLIRLLDLIIEQ